MPEYAVRVELHHAHADDYNVLNDEMDSRGFVRTAKATNGKRYQLPSAEYRLWMMLLLQADNLTNDEATLSHVHTLTKDAIAATIAASQLSRRTSLLTGSCVTSRILSSQVYNLEEAS
jgi:hypothetical protein